MLLRKPLCLASPSCPWCLRPLLSPVRKVVKYAGYAIHSSLVSFERIAYVHSVTALKHACSRLQNTPRHSVLIPAVASQLRTSLHIELSILDKANSAYILYRGILLAVIVTGHDHVERRSTTHSTTWLLDCPWYVERPKLAKNLHTVLVLILLGVALR